MKWILNYFKNQFKITGSSKNHKNTIFGIFYQKLSKSYQKFQIYKTFYKFFNFFFEFVILLKINIFEQNKYELLSGVSDLLTFINLKAKP